MNEVSASHLPHGASAGDTVSDVVADTRAGTNTWTRRVAPGVLMTAAVFLEISAAQRLMMETRRCLTEASEGNI